MVAFCRFGWNERGLKYSMCSSSTTDTTEFKSNPLRFGLFRDALMTNVCYSSQHWQTSYGQCLCSISDFIYTCCYFWSHTFPEQWICSACILLLFTGTNIITIYHYGPLRQKHCRYSSNLCLFHLLLIYLYSSWNYYNYVLIFFK